MNSQLTGTPHTPSLAEIAPLYRRMRAVHPDAAPLAITRYLLDQEGRQFWEFIWEVQGWLL